MVFGPRGYVKRSSVWAREYLSRVDRLFVGGSVYGLDIYNLGIYPGVRLVCTTIDDLRRLMIYDDVDIALGENTPSEFGRHLAQLDGL